jgi:hypothetical protein
LDWRPLYEDLYRYFIRVNADPPVNDSLGKSKDLNHLTRLARHAQKYFPASEIPAILEKILPEVTLPPPLFTLFQSLLRNSSKHTSSRERSIQLDFSLSYCPFNSHQKKILLQKV